MDDPLEVLGRQEPEGALEWGAHPVGEHHAGVNNSPMQDLINQSINQPINQLINKWQLYSINEGYTFCSFVQIETCEIQMYVLNFVILLIDPITLD